MLDLNEGEQSDSDDIGSREVAHLSTADIVSWNAQISKLFLVNEMPGDFYDLWAFCKKLCPAHPEGFFLYSFSKQLIIALTIMYVFRCISTSWI